MNRIFPNKKAAWLYIDGTNKYEIKKSMCHTHFTRGLLKKVSGGWKIDQHYLKNKITLKEHGKTESTANDERIDKMADTKLRQQLNREKKEELELGLLQRKYALRADINQKIVARGISMQAQLNHDLLRKHKDLIELVGGDLGKSQDFLAACTTLVKEAVSVFAEPVSFTVSVEPR